MVPAARRGERLQDLWLDPHFPMWYLLALVAWRLVTPLLRPLPGAVVVAVAISIGSGFLQGEWMALLDLPRILGFLPFLVLGLKTTPEALEWVRGRFPAVLGAVTFAVIAVLAVNLDRWASTGYLYQRPFDLMDVPDSTAVLTRLLVMAVGLAGTFAWLALVPRRSGWFTRMGAATLIVYLFHGFAVKGAEFAGFQGWAGRHEVWSLVLTTLLGLALSLLLAAPPVASRLTYLVDPFGYAERHTQQAAVLAVAADNRPDMADEQEPR